MKYNYWFEEVDLGDSHKSFAIRFSEDMLPLQIFLCSDVNGRLGKDRIFALKYVDKVLNGESKFEAFTGNACYVEVRKEKTKIEYMFTNKDTEDSCEVETNALKELIEIWLKEKEAYYNKF